MSYTRIDCRKCRYSYITWDPNNPNGCKKFGFKTKLLPSDIVYQSSGEICNGFEEKNPKNK
ncbi:hypothetical protein JCM19376_14840 [Fusibacter bizertensis]